MAYNKHIDYLSELDEDVTLDRSGRQAWGYQGPGWYFWDETEAYCYGPYKSEKEAEIALNRYAETL